MKDLDKIDDLTGGHEEPASEPEQPKQPEQPLLTVEEHAKQQGVAPSVFAAVMQSKGWAAGKRTTKAAFKLAVSAFLGAPMRR
jgi:hypothetical protein